MEIIKVTCGSRPERVALTTLCNVAMANLNCTDRSLETYNQLNEKKSIDAYLHKRYTYTNLLSFL